MDALLGLIIALFVFIGLIFIISRSAKLIVFIGLVIVTILVLRATGVIG